VTLRITAVVSSAFLLLTGSIPAAAQVNQPPLPPVLLLPNEFPPDEIPPNGSTACSDGIDNDGDAAQGGGGIDYPADYGCWGPDDATESFPDDATTGVYSTSTALRGQCATLCAGGLSSSGSINTSAPDTTIQCLELNANATLTIDQPRTTVRCVSGIAGGATIRVNITADDVVIEDSHFSNGTGGGDPQNTDVIRVNGADGVRIERTELSEYGDGVKVMSATNLLLRDNWIHNAGSGGNFSGSHSDAVESDGGAHGMIIEGETHENQLGDTSMLMMDNWAGSSSDISVRRNQFVGVPSWSGITIYCDGTFGGSAMTNIVVVSNMVHPSRGWAVESDWLASGGRCTPSITVSGNRNRDTGLLYGTYFSSLYANPVAQVAAPACNDGIDNDGDGKIDWGWSSWNDSGCASGADTSE